MGNVQIVPTPEKDIIPANLAKSAIWYVFSGKTLDDFNIYFRHFIQKIKLVM